MPKLVYVYTVEGVPYRVTLDVDAICKTAVKRAHRSQRGKCALLKGAVSCQPRRQRVERATSPVQV